MKPYQERVVEERAELSQKLERLKQFLSGDARSVGDGELARLSRQASTMTEYLDILDERIASFRKASQTQQGIGWAIEQLRGQHSVTRKGWNGPGQYLALQVPGPPYSEMTLPYIYIRTVNEKRVPWHASQTDILATDWRLA